MGYFRVGQQNGRYLFFDGQDRPFYSIGVNCAWNPISDPSGERTVDLVQKYGGTGRWHAEWAEEKLRQTAEWGFNTLGAWHEKHYWGNGVPKTVEIRCSRYAKKVNNEWGIGFPDVFDPSFAASAHKAMLECFYEKGEDLLKDEGLIGYYTDNELHWWGTGGKWGSNDPGEGYNDTHLVDDYIDLPADASGKKAWVAFVRQRYDSIEELNRTWDAEYQDFDDLLYIGVYRAKQDVMDELKQLFLRDIAQAYFHTTTSILRLYDPNHLHLGCRMVGTGTPKIVMQVMKQYVDVISLNFYSFDLPRKWMTDVHELTNKPLMVTEFSFCAGRSAGFLYNTNGARKVIVKDQKRRGEAYKDFVELAASLPYLVGTHWFALYDYSNRNGLIGNYGLINANDETYEEFAAEVAVINRRLLERLCDSCNGIQQLQGRE
ncbi:hypothetical protein ACFPPD_09855 [Cohnella suwonensis]|uniref:Beta-agarase n=1 Tax=Cohnella suwonensis TaxID=696072 RepID=A0ABW0LW03_9BACL